MNVQVGAAMVSDGSIVRVMTSALLPLPVPETAIVTAEAVGWRLSIVIAPEDAAVIAVAIAFPAVSEYVQENATAPSVSPSATSIVATWLSSPVVVYATVFAIAAPPDVNVQVGVPTSSDGFRVRVMSSPFESPPASTAEVEVGWVLSIVTEPDVALVIAAAIAFPAVSEYVQENPTEPSLSALSTVTAAVWLSLLTVP